MIKVYCDETDVLVAKGNVVKRQDEVLMLKLVEIAVPDVSIFSTFKIFSEDNSKGILNCKLYTYDNTTKLLVILLASAKQNRVHVRIPIEVPSTVKYFANGSLHNNTCFVMNISIGGLAFALTDSAKEFVIGDTLSMDMSSYFGSQLEGEVIWVNKMSDKEQHIGMQFKNVNSRAMNAIYAHISDRVKIM